MSAHSQGIGRKGGREGGSIHVYHPIHYSAQDVCEFDPT